MEIICAGITPAIPFAAAYLRRNGIKIAQTPGPDTQGLLLDTPVRDIAAAHSVLNDLGRNVTIFGGRLDFPGYRCVDFLKNPEYLSANAYITAECALDVTLPRFSGLIRDCPVLILGWGRIGKCLSKLLRDMGAEVTVAARSASDRAALRALGFGSADPEALYPLLPQFRLLYNTVPAPILSREQTALCRTDCLKFDLASVPGIVGSDVIDARGLPGIYRPEASGELIAQTALRNLNKEVAP